MDLFYIFYLHSFILLFVIYQNSKLISSENYILNAMYICIYVIFNLNSNSTSLLKSSNHPGTFSHSLKFSVQLLLFNPWLLFAQVFNSYSSCAIRVQVLFRHQAILSASSLIYVEKKMVVFQFQLQIQNLLLISNTGIQFQLEFKMTSDIS